MKSIKVCTHSSILFIAVFLLVSCGRRQADSNNFDFESADSLNQPLGWKLNHIGATHYFLDKSHKQHGHQSLMISRNSGDSSFGNCNRQIHIAADVSKITLTGYLKTNITDNGSARLWIRVEDTQGNVVFFDNMSQNPVTGKSDWQKYEISYSVKGDQELTCFLGVLFLGTGTVWADNLDVRLEKDPLNKKNYDKDNTIEKASAALSTKLSEDDITRLHNLCLVWGFLKYYHPAVSKLNCDWDSVLFRLVPLILAPATNDSSNRVLENFIKSLGPVPSCNNCAVALINNNNFRLHSDDVFSSKEIPEKIKQQLEFVRDNYTQDIYNPYFQTNKYIGNAVFTNEADYGPNPYPKAALRFLALCRYWNIIEYLYPYRYTIPHWSQTLRDYIPLFINSPDKSKYLLDNLELIGKIHETHANIEQNRLLDSLKGNYILPFKTCFVDDKLIITGYRVTNFDKINEISIGDEIKSIDNISVDSLLKMFLRYTPASNYSTQLQYICSETGFLLRSHNPKGKISITHNNQTKTFATERILLSSLSIIHEDIFTIEKPAYSIIDHNIGYINPSKLAESDFPNLEKSLAQTKGIIVDLRCYPLSLQPALYERWFKSVSSPFVRFSTIDTRLPGKFQLTNTEDFEGTLASNTISVYKGKLVILVNSVTLSNAEFTAMALRTTPNALIVGSQTAGADGNVSSFSLPGNIQTRITGIGVFYPDLSETQGTGIKIDIPASVTIESIKKGKDNYLDKAISLINTK